MIEKIQKFYGLCTDNERRKNLTKYEKLLDIEIDTSLTENALSKNKQYYIDTNQIVPDFRGPVGAVGCTISFCNIYKDIVKHKHSYSMIFEDDIDWNEEFYGECTKEKFLGFVNNIDFDDSWDIFYLGTESTGFLKDQKHIKDNIYELDKGTGITIPIKEKTFKSFDESYKSNIGWKHGNFGGQQAFILTYNGALQLLKYHDPAYGISDGIVGYAIANNDIINRSFIPTIFTQLSHPRNYFINKLWSSLTGVDHWRSDEQYSPNMTKIKKGCSGWPLSKEYDRGMDRPGWKIEEGNDRVN